MGVHFGKDARILNNSGTYGTPILDNVSAVRDVQIPDGDFAELEASGRDYALELVEPGMLKLTVEGKMRTNESDTTGFGAFNTAALARTMLDIHVLTGGQTVNGNIGFRFDAKLTKWFGEDQNIDQVLYRPFRLRPCFPTNMPKSVVISSGAPVYTNLTLGFA